MSKTPDPIDRHVGAKLRERRTALAMSQERLGQQLGLTFQQIQKYEKGANRIGAGRLFQISQILDAPVQFFFDGAPCANEDDAASEVTGFLGTVEGLQLNLSFQRIKDAETRRRLLDLIQSLSELETGDLKA